MAAKKKNTEPIKHSLIPEHKKLSEKEKKELLEKHGISVYELPNILASDPALRGMDVKPGDIIRIKRKSPTAGVTYAYRGVVNG
ncbi:DNA-directed RNA polymerase subunit H [Candidatus Woesearchaeota archaeon]|nr:MAG: DNA-directed RNA polymerase subunit H [Candidatus Woesearchaeota archaeon]